MIEVLVSWSRLLLDLTLTVLKHAWAQIEIHLSKEVKVIKEEQLNEKSCAFICLIG